MGFGPSSKTWPRCPSQREQCTSVRFMKKERSTLVPTAPGNTPARATVEAGLASPDYKVEIMVVAAK